MKIGQKNDRQNTFIPIVYRNRGELTKDESLEPGLRKRLLYLWADTAATPPSGPSPLSEVGGKGAAVLPLTWMLSHIRGCRRRETPLEGQFKGSNSLIRELRSAPDVNCASSSSRSARLCTPKELCTPCYIDPFLFSDENTVAPSTCRLSPATLIRLPQEVPSCAVFFSR